MMMFPENAVRDANKCTTITSSENSHQRRQTYPTLSRQLYTSSCCTTAAVQELRKCVLNHAHARQLLRRRQLQKRRRASLPIIPVNNDRTQANTKPIASGALVDKTRAVNVSTWKACGSALALTFVLPITPCGRPPRRNDTKHCATLYSR